MTTFIFIGDMLVMLFMFLLVVWVSVYASDEALDKTAKIPLEDEQADG